MTDYSKHYDEQTFLRKLARVSKKLGKKFVVLALTLYYALLSDKVPAWARTTIIGALGYLVFPADAVPDVVPVAGFVDDASVLTAALGAVAVHVDDDIRRQAREKANEWF